MNKIIVNADQTGPVISRHIYGHFAEHLGRCIYEGIWVGEDSPIPNTRGIRNDIVDALREINIPNLRWPGGCFADTYHWKDGIGPRENRPSIVNVHWGGTTENNHFGTHEFLDLCEMLDCEPYICGNVGSGTVQEMAEWVEYLTMPKESPQAKIRRENGRDAPWAIKYWAVGNENWGCGGDMTALQYAWEFRKYQGYCRHFGGKKLYKVACGYDDAWNETVVREAHKFMDGLSVHHYTIPHSWEKKGDATQFDQSDWFTTLQKARDMDGVLTKTDAILTRHDPEKRIGIIMDEWGTWFDVEAGTNPGFLYQQNTLRDALVAGVTFHIFHDHAARVHMANIAQTVNVLQAMVLTDGPKMIKTPTFHVFEMFKSHQNGTRLNIDVQSETFTNLAAASNAKKSELPRLTASASRGDDGKVTLSLCSLHPSEAVETALELRGLTKGVLPEITGRVLTANEITAHNTFDAPDTVKPEPFTDWVQNGSTLTVSLPARSVVVLQWE